MVGPVVLLGVPGAGKGTQAKRIIAHYGVPHVSTGDMFREVATQTTALATKVRSFMERGELLPDAVVCEMVAERLARPDCRRGFILDGFPRTLPQAQWLFDFLTENGWEGERRLVVIYLSVGYNDLFRRLSGRRTCPTCGRIYNDYTQPSRQSGVCDVDNTPLVQRKDDDPDVIRERLIAYEEQTLPLVECFRQRSHFYQICGTDPIDKVTASVFSALDGRGRKP
jgi:adenylate kinase